MKHWLLLHPPCKVQQFPAYIHILHNRKIKIPIIYLSHFKSTKGRGGKKLGKGKQNLNSSLNHLSLPPKKRNNLKRQIITITTKTTEGIIQATNPTGATKAEVENLIEAPNEGEGVSKIIIGNNTKATAGNTTPPTEAITIIIINAITEVEVDVVVVVIITEVAATVEAVIKAITITNTTNITHMMMVHRWSNMAHHVHFVVVTIDKVLYENDDEHCM